MMFNSKLIICNFINHYIFHSPWKLIIEFINWMKIFKIYCVLSIKSILWNENNFALCWNVNQVNLNKIKVLERVENLFLSIELSSNVFNYTWNHISSYPVSLSSNIRASFIRYTYIWYFLVDLIEEEKNFLLWLTFTNISLRNCPGNES